MQDGTWAMRIHPAKGSSMSSELSLVRKILSDECCQMTLFSYQVTITQMTRNFVMSGDNDLDDKNKMIKAGVGWEMRTRSDSCRMAGAHVKQKFFGGKDIRQEGPE